MGGLAPSEMTDEQLVLALIRECTRRCTIAAVMDILRCPSPTEATLEKVARHHDVEVGQIAPWIGFGQRASDGRWVPMLDEPEGTLFLEPYFFEGRVGLQVHRLCARWGCKVQDALH